MTTTIICPNCATEFEPTAALALSIREDMRKEFNQKWSDEQKKKEEEFKNREAAIYSQQQLLTAQAQRQEDEVNRRLEESRRKMEGELSKQLAQKIQLDFEARLSSLQEADKEKDEKLAAARAKELDFIRKMQALQQKEQELELVMNRKLLEERGKLFEVVRKEEDEKGRIRDAEYQMKLKEMEKQLDDQRRLADEMRRKAEQGSIQLQGEVQELALEQLLRHSFPFDVISEVGKGVKGADCIQTVRNSFGQECGKIIYESKRTKDFSMDWIEKLKADSRVLSADVAVIVTQAMPKDMDCFGEKDGIWICDFSEAAALVAVLRDLIIKVHNATKNHDNKGDKMTLLYNYLISHEFSGQWKAIREGFMTMKMSIQKERDQMERLWKSREKQLEKVLLNAAHIQGSIEGIAGMEAIDLTLNEDSGFLLE